MHATVTTERTPRERNLRVGLKVKVIFMSEFRVVDPMGNGAEKLQKLSSPRRCPKNWYSIRFSSLVRSENRPRESTPIESTNDYWLRGRNLLRKSVLTSFFRVAESVAKICVPCFSRSIFCCFSHFLDDNYPIRKNFKVINKSKFKPGCVCTRNPSRNSMIAESKYCTYSNDASSCILYWRY